jgi:hypothetical protein
MNTEAATNSPTMDLEQAAAFLHLGYKAMKALVDTGEVPALSLNQKHTILLRDDLITYVREQGRAQAARRRSRKPIDAPPTRAKRSISKPNLDAYERTGGDR